MTQSQPPASGDLTEAPIPKKLRELLEEFPECIVQLEVALAKVVAEPASIVTPLERAVSAIEDVAEALNVQARKRLESSLDAGDAEKVASAEREMKLLNRLLWKELWAGDPAFVKFFQPGSTTESGR